MLRLSDRKPSKSRTVSESPPGKHIYGHRTCIYCQHTNISIHGCRQGFQSRLNPLHLMSTENNLKYINRYRCIDITQCEGGTLAYMHPRRRLTSIHAVSINQFSPSHPTITRALSTLRLLSHEVQNINMSTSKAGVAGNMAESIEYVSITRGNISLVWDHPLISPATTRRS